MLPLALVYYNMCVWLCGLCGMNELGPKDKSMSSLPHCHSCHVPCSKQCIV